MIPKVDICDLIFMLMLCLDQHPAYQAHMTKTETQQQQEQQDLEEMPELRYNQSQPVAAAPSSGKAAPAHVVV